MKKFVTVILIVMTIITAQISCANQPFAQRPDVQQFIDYMVKKHHFNQQNLTLLFTQVHYHPQIIHSIIQPLEKQSWQTYRFLFVNHWRIKGGVEYWAKHADTLARAEKTYGVPAGIIVATLGVETKYGKRMGGFRVIDSLSNIGFSQSPRARYFRYELEQFLLLTRDKKLDPLKITGSYAGAIGQPQFMPSSYRTYAVNFSRNGKIDLIHNDIDAIGSVANYYHRHGWQYRYPVAIPATITDKHFRYLYGDIKNNTYPISEWVKQGIAPKDKSIANKNNDKQIKLKVIQLPGHFHDEYWLGYHNFTVIKRYNPSDLYAMAVYQLSKAIEASYKSKLAKQINPAKKTSSKVATKK